VVVVSGQKIRAAHKVSGKDGGRKQFFFYNLPYSLVLAIPITPRRIRHSFGGLQPTDNFAGLEIKNAMKAESWLK